VALMGMRTVTRWLAAAVVGLSMAGAASPAAAGAAMADPCALPGVAPPATYAHVVVIMEENAAYSKVVGSSNAPLFNQLAGQCALATNYHDDAGVSQPNYMAATGGNATGVGVHANTPSIFSQAASWNELEESMGAKCGGTTTFYKRGHDPAFWYTPLAAACKLNDLPVAATDAGTISLPATLPAYTFITPNLCHNDHWQTGCSEPNTTAGKLLAMDTWLGGVVGEITQTTDYQQGRTLILVAFDESSTSTTTRVPAIAIAGGIQPATDNTLYDHYALLRASEEALGITTYLGNAAAANDMRTGMHF
jgi:phosphatidylinositol-3-phosphatase